MVNNINFKNATNNAISLMGMLGIEEINELELSLVDMVYFLEDQSLSLICEVENVTSIQSQIINNNCLKEIEDSINRVSKSISESTLNSARKIISNMESKISELEQEIRQTNIEKFNEVCQDTTKMEELIKTLKSNNARAVVLFEGDSLRQSLLDTFVSEDSSLMESSKDNIISAAITYVDFTVRKYDEYIEKIEKMIDVIEDTKIMIASCKAAKKMLFNYSKNLLLAMPPSELYSLTYDKIKEVL